MTGSIVDAERACERVRRARETSGWHRPPPSASAASPRAAAIRGRSARPGRIRRNPARAAAGQRTLSGRSVGLADNPTSWSAACAEVETRPPAGDSRSETATGDRRRQIRVQASTARAMRRFRSRFPMCPVRPADESARLRSKCAFPAGNEHRDNVVTVIRATANSGRRRCGKRHGCTGWRSAAARSAPRCWRPCRRHCPELARQAPPGSNLGTQSPIGAAPAMNATVGAWRAAAGRDAGPRSAFRIPAQPTYRIPLWTPPGSRRRRPRPRARLRQPQRQRHAGRGLVAVRHCRRSRAATARWAQDGVAAGVTNTPADRLLPRRPAAEAGQRLARHSRRRVRHGGRVVLPHRCERQPPATGPHPSRSRRSNGLDLRVRQHRRLARVRRRNSAPFAPGHCRACATVRDRHRQLDRAHLCQRGAVRRLQQRHASHRIHRVSDDGDRAGPVLPGRLSATRARPASDVPTGYLAGIWCANRTSSTASRCRRSARRRRSSRMRLTYDTAPVTGRLRLAACRSAAHPRCLRPTTITYQNGASGWQPMHRHGRVCGRRQRPRAARTQRRRHQ